MRNIPFVAILIFSIIVIGCNNVSTTVSSNTELTPSFTEYPTKPGNIMTSTNYEKIKQCLTLDKYPTLWVNHLGPCGRIDLTYTPIFSPTAPKIQNIIDPLPGGLFLEEYKLEIKIEVKQEIDKEGQTYSRYIFTKLVNDPWKNIPNIYERHPTIGGWYFWPQGGELNGQLFSALSGDGYIIGKLDQKVIYKDKCNPGGFQDGVITAWTFQNNWIIQSYCEKHYEIIWNGERINQIKNYQESYAFQLLDNKPFYLFLRDNQVWVYYDEIESMLGYEGIMIDYSCCSSMPEPPQHYERAIEFKAYIEPEYYYVVIGID
jgi:hypothetical protein